MPIRPEMRGFYPSNWPEISRRVRFDPKKVNVIVSSVGDTFANANEPETPEPVEQAGARLTELTQKPGLAGSVWGVGPPKGMITVLPLSDVVNS